ncbi:hypothetical protein EV700_0229 [Fluviicoccus keumensis]|uniref:Uncharacterized protein n=1 Tax=Fluviicoccus keumensis TaxID=1435465 RepID=A0A4Q7ZBG0_9GAMM|nr:UDP-glycosyltransferase [Fluviicoccus keumensis]RZU47275.1 hypothetical protein EV700_0229 [Fluviicoccus keumensis]
MAAAKRVLFVCYGGGHVAMVLPVAQAMCEAGAEVLVLALTTAYARAQAAGLPVIGFRDLVDPVADAEALAWGRELAGQMAASDVVAPEETIAYLGLSFADLAERCGGEAAARAEYARQGRHAFLPRGPMRRLMDRWRPDVVVATNSPRAERAAIEVAGECGIPSVCMVDLFATQESAWIGRPGYASRVCVLSPFVRERLVACGRVGGEIVVTGNPAFDRLGDASLTERAAAWRAEKGLAGRKLVVWASQDEPAIHPFSGRQGYPEVPRQIDRALLDALGRHPDWFVVIRHHPSEQVALTPLPERAAYSSRQDDLAVLLKAADVVVVMSSTVGLEAALLAKPVIAVELSASTPDVPYVPMGIARGIGRVEDLEAAVMAALSVPSAAAPGGGLPAPGHATPNVAAVIESLFNECRG